MKISLLLLWKLGLSWVLVLIFGIKAIKIRLKTHSEENYVFGVFKCVLFSDAGNRSLKLSCFIINKHIRTLFPNICQSVKRHDIKMCNQIAFIINHTTRWENCCIVGRSEQSSSAVLKRSCCCVVVSILDARQKRAEELKRLTDRSASMSEEQLTELRADIKVNPELQSLNKRAGGLNIWG